MNIGKDRAESCRQPAKAQLTRVHLLPTRTHARNAFPIREPSGNTGYRVSIPGRDSYLQTVRSSHVNAGLSIRTVERIGLSERATTMNEHE